MPKSGSERCMVGKGTTRYDPTIAGPKDLRSWGTRVAVAGRPTAAILGGPSYFEPQALE